MGRLSDGDRDLKELGERKMLKDIVNSYYGERGGGSDDNFGCILRPRTDTFAELNGRGARPADANLTALG